LKVVKGSNCLDKRTLKQTKIAPGFPDVLKLSEVLVGLLHETRKGSEIMPLSWVSNSYGRHFLPAYTKDSSSVTMPQHIQEGA
jgi:hypothetical protein